MTIPGLGEPPPKTGRNGTVQASKRSVSSGVFTAAFPQGSMRSERPPPHGKSVLHGVLHGRAWREVRGTKKGGSLTSPSLFPVPPQVLWEEGGNSKGLNKMGERDLGTLGEPQNGTHPPLCVYQTESAPPIRPRRRYTGGDLLDNIR